MGMYVVGRTTARYNMPDDVFEKIVNKVFSNCCNYIFRNATILILQNADNYNFLEWWQV